MESESDSSPTAATLLPAETHRQKSPNRRGPPPPCHAFGVAIVCALPIEATAVAILFDETWDDAALAKAPTDTNAYSVGAIGAHRVVLVHLPSMGKVASATGAGNLRSSFPRLGLVLLVGICGGAPKVSAKKSDELLLGDVVVSTGVVQYDLGRRFPGHFVRKDTPHDNLSKLSLEAGALLAKLQAEPGREQLSSSVAVHLDSLQQRLCSEVAYPGRTEDKLFKPNYLHKHRGAAECPVCTENVDAVCDQAFERSCDELGCGQHEADLESRLRPERLSRPVVHFGLVASGDTVMRSGSDRDGIAGRDGVIAFEMEGAGMWEILRSCSCLIVKSICDYADSHKNKKFQAYAAAVAAATAKAVLESWDACKPDSLQPRDSNQYSLRRKAVLSARDIRLLSRLKTVPYADRKDRNPHRVLGTCEWFVGHKLFREWLQGSQGKPLWVSADPGCGKSVLARYLVDDVLQTTETRTTCYFFFKDDFKEQKSAANAISCLLHQILTQQPQLLSDAVRARLKADGETLITSFRDLWNLLLDVAEDQVAGEIVCVLDALDECGSEDSGKLARALLEQRRRRRVPNLKFLLTSRPFGSIRRSFQPPDIAELAVVHLSGESQAELEEISKEIDIFIRARVRSISARLYLQDDEQDRLLGGLLSVPHRTYLWVYLTLDLLESDVDISKDKIEMAISKLPMSVDHAYERILSTSCDAEEAKKALHIIVVAETPLTLREMNFALALRPTHKSYEDVELRSDEWFKERLRDICGLFVTIMDSKVYLLHQTAREFLVRVDTVEEKPSKTLKLENDEPPLKWKHSLDPPESHRVLGEICLWHLRFPELYLQDATGVHPHELFARVIKSNFLQYSAYFWAVHLRATHVKLNQHSIEDMVELCHACHRHRPCWFLAAVHAHGHHPRLGLLETSENLLMMASFFGLAPAISALINAGRGDLLARDSQGKTALIWAAGLGHLDAAKMLIKSQGRGVFTALGWLGMWKPPIIDVTDNMGLTPLMHAVEGGSAVVAKLLLDKGADLEARCNNGGTALWWSTGRPTVMRLLLEKGANVEAKDSRMGMTPLVRASGWPAADTVQLLLQYGADVDGKDGRYGNTALMWAIEEDRGETVKLLLEHTANLELTNNKGHTAFSIACHLGRLGIARLLLDRGVDVESRDPNGTSALSKACRGGSDSVVELLLKYGADVESQNAKGMTPLAEAAASWDGGQAGPLIPRAVTRVNSTRRDETSPSHWVLTDMNPGGRRVITLLLEHGADIEHKDVDGRTPLSHATNSLKGPEFVTLLLEKGANVHAADKRGKTPLFWATDKKVDTNVAKVLIQHGADVNARDAYGRTPFSLASGKTGNARTAELLREMGA